MQRFIVYVLLLYLVVLAFGMNFFFTAVSLDIPVAETFIFVLPTLLTGLFILIYALRARISNLAEHEKALHFIIYILLAISVAVTAVFLVPLFYS